MEKFTLYFGKWLQIPVYIHWSWSLFFLMYLAFDSEYAIIYAGIFFLVLLHEFGHCLAFKLYNLKVLDVTLYPFGGIARGSNMPEEPIKEIVVALAGPLVNLIFIPILYFLPSEKILNTIEIGNIVLLCFNLVPAFPLDGGRVLRALLFMCLGDRRIATKVCVIIGWGFCALFLGYGIIMGNFMLVVVAAFLVLAGIAEMKVAGGFRKYEKNHIETQWFRESEIFGNNKSTDINMEVVVNELAYKTGRTVKATKYVDEYGETKYKIEVE